MRHSLALVVAACAACATSNSAGGPDKPLLPLFEHPADPTAPKGGEVAKPVLIRGGTLMTATGQRIDDGYLLLEGGRIAELGPGAGPESPDAAVIDAKGHFITPGLIDSHSHMGVFPMPYVNALSDGNERTRPNTAEVWAEHSFWPQDPTLWLALAGGVTTVQVLPGSANLFGGRSFVAKLRPRQSARQMRFPGAPQGLKMACGENPKRVYGNQGGPHTRMGNVAGYRAAFQAAIEYRRSLQRYRRDLAAWQKESDPEEDPPDPPSRNFTLETLVGVLDGKILVHNHCYRADEMHIMLDLAETYGYKIRSFHHATEGYKVRHRLAQQQVAASVWADWWGFKMESYDGIPQNAALLHQAGARVIIHSDSAIDIRQLNLEAAKAMTAGRKVGIDISENDALRWITANPAWALGVDERTGTLEVGKMADVTVWDAHPFSTYAKVERVFIDGHQVHQRKAPSSSDFQLGQSVGVNP